MLNVPTNCEDRIPSQSGALEASPSNQTREPETQAPQKTDEKTLFEKNASFRALIQEGEAARVDSSHPLAVLFNEETVRNKETELKNALELSK